MEHFHKGRLFVEFCTTLLKIIQLVRGSNHEVEMTDRTVQKIKTNQADDSFKEIINMLRL